MTEVLASNFLPAFGCSPFDGMPDQSGQQWRQQPQYYNPAPLVSEWQYSQAEQIPVTHALYAQDTPSYLPDSGSGQMSMPPAYHHDSWGSDIDMGTPSTAGFPQESPDYFSHPQQPFGHLRLPATGAGVHSPQSSHSGPSPQTAPARLEPERPHYTRSLSDPTQKRRGAAPNAGKEKPQFSDEDEDDGGAAAEDTTRSASKGGRKRQRIPHTAVERRYRENLNAHLEKLRQAVPSLAARKGGKVGEGGVKPSKCEVLSGAIEHISATDRENAALRNEVRTLRLQLGEYEGWLRR